jgi:hypothetical protein
MIFRAWMTSIKIIGREQREQRETLKRGKPFDLKNQ